MILQANGEQYRIGIETFLSDVIRFSMPVHQERNSSSLCIGLFRDLIAVAQEQSYDCVLDRDIHLSRTGFWGECDQRVQFCCICNQFGACQEYVDK